MLLKKISIASIAIILSYSYVEVAQANITCQDKYSYAAFGSLKKSDLQYLKKEYVAARRAIKNKDRERLSNYKVQSILGFSGQQTKTASGGKIEHRIWIDRDDCKRKVKASFKNSELFQLKSYGF